MIFRLILASAVAFFCAISAGVAQQSYIQIEAHPSQDTAIDRARSYSGAIADVSGFRIGQGNFYAVVLGPYSRSEANTQLRNLRNSGIIPPDSYLTDGRTYNRRIWPLAGSTTQTATSEETGVTVTPAEDTAEAEVETPAAEPKETPREARQSENALSRDEKRQLQTALQWFGFYNSAIDGAFGRGTRRSMSDWQASKAFDVTGVLTTKQRATLLSDYEESLAALGLDQVVETTAGITVTMPARLVDFDRYDYPFVQYKPKDDSQVRVLLISRAGDEATLAGLYEVMQTLEIMPLNGERSLRSKDFTLTGSNNEIASYAFAQLGGGYVKGFALVYPASKSSELDRVAEIMRNSLVATEGALTPEQSDLDTQSLDLLAGLEVRKPKNSQSGVFVDAAGKVLTSSHGLQSCERITVGDEVDAEIVASNSVGLGLLAAKEAIAPIDFARFSSVPARLRSEVAIGGFSYGGQLGSASVTYGTLADLSGLNGEAELKRLEANALPGDLGGPVLNSSGLVSGILINPDFGGRTLPEGTLFAAKADVVTTFLTEQNITISNAEANDAVDADSLAAKARNITVLVHCW